MITGTGVHDRPDSVFTINWNRCSRSNGIDVHHPPERAPICEAVLATGGHFVFVCKLDSHPMIQEYVTGIKLATHIVPVKRGRKQFTHQFRWLSGVPLRDGKDALGVNWFELEIRDPTGKVTYRNSFITDLPVSRETVEERAACGRARWKIESVPQGHTERSSR